MQNYGKQFEKKFASDVIKVPGVSVDRILDVTYGYKSISNVSDFIVYKYPEIFYMEIKSIHGNTFPLTNLTQYEKLLRKKGIKGVNAGVTIWFIDHQRVVYVPITTFERLKDEGAKSLNIRTLDLSEYGVIEVPSIKKRVFLDSDYSVIFKGTDYYDTLEVQNE